jgi:hypothetical protein
MTIDPRRPLEPPAEHVKVRIGLRIAGVVVLSVGALVLLVGASSFFAAFLNFGNAGYEARPGRMVLMLPGLLLVGIGGQMCLLGWAGSIAKYGVREGSPAAAEGVNRVGMGSAPGITAVAAAVGAGLREGGRIACGSCGDPQALDAKFCDACGAAMHRVCPSCGAVGEAGGGGARFCDQCGAGLGGDATA